MLGLILVLSLFFRVRVGVATCRFKTWGSSLIHHAGFKTLLSTERRCSMKPSVDFAFVGKEG